METIYGKVALKTLEKLQSYSGKITKEVVDVEWKNTAKSYNRTDSVIDKSCPLETFCGILFSGEIKGLNIEKDSLDSKNALYGRELISMLKKGKYTTDNKTKIWNDLFKNMNKKPIKQNGQVDIAFALYKNGYIK